MHKVHISLTSISTRIADLHLVLQSLLEQNYSSYFVHLYISREPYLLDEGINEVPMEIEALDISHDNFEIHYTKNTGPYRKLLPILKSEIVESNELVVTADDDTIYPPNWLSELVDAYETHRCVICYRGHYMAQKNGRLRPYKEWMKYGIRENPSLNILPTGKNGILYSPKQLSSSVLKTDEALKVAPTADDLWFKWHTAALGTKVFCIDNDYKTEVFKDASKTSDTSLYEKFNRDQGNDACIQRLCRYSENYLGMSFFRAQLEANSSNKIKTIQSRPENTPLAQKELYLLIKYFCSPLRLAALILNLGSTRQTFKDAFTILLSSQFDIYHYLSQIRPKKSSVIHYLEEGHKKNLEPFIGFSEKQYSLANPDVAESGMNAYMHYIVHGRFENRRIK